MSHLNINGVDKPLDHVYVKARTENLFDASTLANDLHLSPSTGFPSSYSGRIATTTTIDVSAYTELTLTFSIQIASGTLAFMYSKFYNGSLVERVAGLESGSTIDVSDADSLYIAFYVGGHNITTDNVNWVMLNAGSTALPYQPYFITKEAWEARTRVILHGLTNPLCGIGTYKDTLDLSTGPLTRYITKLVLTGSIDENWREESSGTNKLFQLILANTGVAQLAICSHYTYNTISVSNTVIGFGITSNGLALRIRPDNVTTVFLSDFKTYLADQYAAGTPVTVWYVLVTPTTETITVPSNLTGTVEGFLTQTGTPSPTNPIYPTANGTPEQGSTYSLDTGAYAIAWGRADTFIGTNSISARCYGLPVKSWEIDGNSQQTGTPTPDNPIMPEFVGVRTGNLFNKDSSLIQAGAQFLSNGSIEVNSNYSIWTIGVGNLEAGHDYAISLEHTTQSTSTCRVCGYKNGQYVENIAAARLNNMPISFTMSDNWDEIRFSIRDNAPNVMVNLGSAPLQYEPYGYAIQPYSSTQNTVSGQTPLTLTDSVGHNLISWDGEGATTLSGTPAPTSPVTVSGWGDRTENLFDLNATDTTNGYVNGAYLTSDGLESANSPYRISEYIEIQGSTEYTLVYGNSLNNPSLCFYDSSKQYISGQKYGSNRTVTVTSPSNAKYIRISYFETAISDVMLNSGSTDLPYEPYGWKLSFTSAGQTTPVYLGQVATTRRVRKLVLTGQENWNAYADIADCYRLDLRTNPGIIGNGLCTHFAIVENTSLLTDGTFVSGQNYAYFKDTSAQNLDGWKAYLAAQYAAGTPVVVWYVLAEPTTGIVNEPLMKIGDYADSITSTQAGVTIPTAKGNATLTTSNAVQPSTMHATYDKYISGGDVPVYLGEVSTMRRIGKFVFTGNENITRTQASGGSTRMYYVINAAMPSSPLYCTHFLQSSASSVYPPIDQCYINGISNFIMGVDGTQFETAEDFKQWLADEYAAGTPVTIWYVLAEPETDIVNEPLCKIGDYVDTLTSEQAGITIPTTDGNNTISVDTTLSPSRFEVKVHAKPI